MTLPQGLSFAVIGLVVLLFVWSRFRYDVVALIGLVAAVGVGIIPADRALPMSAIVVLCGTPLIAAIWPPA